MPELIIGCAYHTVWQSNKGYQFILAEVKGEKALLRTKNIKKEPFWTNASDLIFINTPHDLHKAKQLTAERHK